MKRIGVIVLSLFCVFLCSCQKVEPVDMLLGTWEVSSRSTYREGNAAYTVENGVVYYDFKEGGEGRIVMPHYSDQLQELDEWLFTYSYDKENSAIHFQYWSGKEKFSWIVDDLNGLTFTCHTESNVSYTTYSGTKMKREL